MLYTAINSHLLQGMSQYPTANQSEAMLLHPQPASNAYRNSNQRGGSGSRSNDSLLRNLTPDDNLELSHMPQQRSDVVRDRSTDSDRTNHHELSSRAWSHAPISKGTANVSQMPVNAATENHELDDDVDSDGIRTEIPRTREEWRSWKVSSWFYSLMLFTHIVFIVALLIIAQRSAKGNGLVALPKLKPSSNNLEQFFISRYTRYYSLLWVTLPALVFSLYGTAIATVVAGSYERQPYVELYYGGNARRTIMLDYRAYPIFYNYAVAFKHKHIHLGCAMLLAFIATTVTAPLSAHLLVATWTVQNTTEAVSYAGQFNDSFLIGNTNLQPYIDIATAVHSYGSSPPRWMTTEYAFVPFATVNRYANYANLSAHTDAYSAYLDCNVIDSSNYTTTYSRQGTEFGNELGTVTFAFNDRSCSVEQALVVSSNTQTYTLSWQANCPGQTHGRIGILVATYSASASARLSGRSVISCIPSYWHSDGILTVAQSNSSSLGSNYISFHPNNSRSMSPAFSGALEVALQQYTIFNPSATTSANAIGFAVLSAANGAVSNNAAAATPELIRNAMELIFSTVYAGLASSKLLVNSGIEANGSAILSAPVEKLYVSEPIAYILVAILVLVCASHVALWVYAMRHRSILTEEAKSLISTAALLEGDDIRTVLKEIRAAPNVKNPDIRETLKNKFTVESSRCKWNWDQRQIVIDGLARKPSHRDRSS